VSDLVIRRARLGERLVDVRISGGRITEIVGAGERPEGPLPRGAVDVDALGGWILPGLHDHHIHLRALSAAKASVDVGPPNVTDERQLAEALTRAPVAGPDSWVRAVGYHESVAGDLDRDVLDRWVPDRPLRVQHRSGILWVLNSRGLEVVAADSEPGPGVERDSSGRPTGRLWRMDEWLSSRTAWLDEGHFSALLGGLSRRAAATGVIGWTDATPNRSDPETEVLARLVASGEVLQRLHLMVRPGAGSDETLFARLTPQDDRSRLVSTGPVKIILDDFDLPALDGLAATVRTAHLHERPVAIHCVTRTQLVLALAAIDDAGGLRTGDRIEHGAVIAPELIPELTRGAGATVVTQPNFVFERGDDYLRDVEPGEIGNLWRAASLVSAGVTVAAGTDAPFGGEDPWHAIRAATERRTSSGASLGESERVDAARAFSWFCGPGRDPGTPRRVATGQPADLVVLAEPLGEVVADESPPPVVATVVDGAVVYP
jgi:predicted amidohydrolase YtcJ